MQNSSNQGRIRSMKGGVAAVTLFLALICPLWLPAQLSKFRADSLFEAREYDQAAKVYRQLAINLNLGGAEAAQWAFRAARSYSRNGDLDSALVWSRKAAYRYQELGMIAQYHQARVLESEILDDQGAYKEAESIARESAEFFKARGDSYQAATTLNSLALYQYHIGKVDTSILTYWEAIGWAGNQNDPLKAKCYNQLGNIWAEDMKDEHRALSYYRKSLDYKIRSSATPKSIAFSYNNLGVSFKNLGQWDSAFYYYDLALTKAMESGEPAAALSPLINKANLQKRTGDYDAAIRTFNRALEISDHARMNLRSTLHINLGINYNELGQYDRALVHLAKAEALIDSTRILADRRDLEIQKALAYQGKKDYRKALEAQRWVTALNDSLYARKASQEMADLLVRYESIQKDMALMAHQKMLQEKDLVLKNRTIGLIALLGLLLIAATILYFRYRQKGQAARQTALELSLSEEKKQASIQKERLRISRDLHDNIGAYLTLINATLEPLPDLPPHRIQQLMPELQKTLSLSMRDLRKTVWLLNNPQISVETIALRMRDFFRPLNQQGYMISVQTRGNGQKMLSDIQTTHLFRIVQEGVSNACKYAECQNISIELVVDDEESKIRFSLLDDGKGFSLIDQASGNGLKNMKARMGELQGELHIQSEWGQGTRIEGWFPDSSSRD